MRRGDDTRPGRELRGGPLVRRPADIHGEAAEPTGVQRRRHRILVQQFAAGHVDEICPFLHGGERGGVDEVLGLGRGGGEGQDEVGAAEELVQVDGVHAGDTGRSVRVVGEYPHADPHEKAGEVSADRAQADDACRAPRQLRPAALWRLASGVVVLGRGGDRSGDIEHEPEGELGRGGDEALVGIGHQHACRTRRIDVDRAHVDGRAEERDEAVGRRKQRGLTGSRAMGHDHVDVVGVLDQLRGREVTIQGVAHHLGHGLDPWQRRDVVRLEIFRVVGEEHAQHESRG